MNETIRAVFIPGKCYSIPIKENMTILDAIKEAHHLSNKNAVGKVIKIKAYPQEQYMNISEARERLIDPNTDELILFLSKVRFGEPPCFYGDCKTVERQPQNYQETFCQLDDNCERCWDIKRKMEQDQDASVLQHSDLEG